MINNYDDRPIAPLFSIITVTYNAADTLPRTLASVKAQSCHLYEHLIIDGSSSDATLQLAKDAGIQQMKIHSGKDNGIYDAMNKGLGMAQGEYVIFLNAGDAFHSSDTLQEVADAIMDNDFPGIVYGQTDIVDINGIRLGDRHLHAPSELTLDSFRDGMVVCHQAFIVLRRITAPYNLKYRYSADYDWCIRCLQHSRRNVYIDDVLIDYLNEGTTTRNHRRSLRERFRIMCYYYGTFSTIKKHLSFIPRYLRRRKNAVNNQ
ncbi:MAG: glycosyltransferase family 2 protein [Bacteroidales bacterium]|nr:glycosyltransferase family 2 protein [Bacteroidales bacterium]